MANLQERRNKDGKLISYSIRVHRGRGADGRQLKPYITTFDVSDCKTEKTARKKAEAYAAVYEKQCRDGLVTMNRQTFQEYCEYCIELKQQRGIKRSTINRYRDLATRIFPYIGHIKLNELRPDHLNDIYTDLQKEGKNLRTGGKLSNKTILEHHRLIHTVLEQALKEGLVIFNAADRVTLPKAERKEVSYFQISEVIAIREALELEPIKWKTITHLFLITGARRGEILGLKWDAINFEKEEIYIRNNLLYNSHDGLYEDSPKTSKSKRTIPIPSGTVQLLRQYKAWQTAERLRLGSYYINNDFVFTQEDGQPMHPDSVNRWLEKFSVRHNLPRIHPHAFRHSMASILYFEGMDSVSISSRLGHAQVSTTANIYAHVLEEANRKNSDILDRVILQNA